MNVVTPRPPREPTQAAEGLPRWRWTLDEFERLIELGILTEDDRVELIGGELVPMASKGNRHEVVRAELELWFNDRRPADMRVLVEIGWRPDGATYCEPDLLVVPVKLRPVTKVPPAEVRLLIEVADTSLKFDTSTKAALYAYLGVREYWIVNAVTLETKVHRNPTAKGYASSDRVAAGEPLSVSFLPGHELRLRDLELGSE